MLPRGAPVLLLPIANAHDASGMYYQALADFRFVQPAGYALRPQGPTGTDNGPPDSPLVRLDATATRDFPANGIPDFAPGDVAAAQLQLTEQKYRTIVVIIADPHARQLAALAERLTGRTADRTLGGVMVWMLDPHAGPTR
jgi:hypothetical protein